MKKNIARKTLEKTTGALQDINIKSVRFLKLVNPLDHNPLKHSGRKNLGKTVNSTYKFMLEVFLPQLIKWAKSPTVIIVVIFVTTFTTAGVLEFFLENSDQRKDQFTSVWDGIWWGIVTVTTTGYGDHFPLTVGGRILAGLLMCFGIITSGLVTGNIASWLVERKMRQNQGLVDLSDHQDHIIICGWKNEMATVLKEIFSLNPTLKQEDLVIVAPISQETLEKFRSNDEYAKVNILRGDYFNKAMLEHAAVKFAQKALVLADEAGAQTNTEADAKTVMTVMTIKKMAPKVFVAAEITDSKFNNYLKLGQCDEIIHSNEYSRILVANSARSEGLSHILYDLLNVNTDARVITRTIGQEWVGKTFGELLHTVRVQFEVIPIGLLENTGNIQEIKKEALASAQKNPNTRHVLSNLKQIKQIEVNLPVLNPKRDYIIKPHSMMVLIGKESNLEEMGV